jgi:hypothetical protein
MEGQELEELGKQLKQKGHQELKEYREPGELLEQWERHGHLGLKTMGPLE